MRALITGASAGIGRSLAFLFARDGFDLVLVARRQAVLEGLARELPHGGASPRVIAADLAMPGGAVQLYEALQRDGLDVDVLVNNAGFGLNGRFDQLPFDRQSAMVQLNVTSLTELTRLLLPGMLARGRGGVLNVASTAAFQPGPLMAVYYATKAYVLSFTEAIADEVAASPLKVSCLAPGPTHTEFEERAAMGGTRLFKGPVMTADEVARIGFEGWKAGKRLVIPGLRNRLVAFSVRLAPRSSVLKIARRFNERE